jgi:acetolactate synthase-1/2/3 large subunit
MIRVADYIVRRLESFGVGHVFLVTGGGAMHLDDAIGRGNIRYICNHHEQASAIAAEGYARTRNGLGVAVVTSGPGGTNALTGVLGQWLDSVPVVYLSGQVKQETCVGACPEIPLRQLGDQEIDIVRVVESVTKYATMLRDPRDVRRELEKAVHIARSGRPGPVWIDVPLDVQGAMVDEDSLEPYDPGEEPPWARGERLDALAADAIRRLSRADRPVIVAGHGIRIAGAAASLRRFAESSGIPVVTTFGGFDLLASDHPLYVGRIGTIGDRAGNFALQNADVALFIGTRNNIRQVSYFWQSFARAAEKIVVDIDAAELQKPTVRPDLAVHADAGDFLEALLRQPAAARGPGWSGWREWCRVRRDRYPTVLPEYRQVHGAVHPYLFVQALCEVLEEDAIVVAGNGTACVALFQAGIVKEGQRFFWNSGCAAMGYDLPAAIGACVASGRKVVCLAGDGSLQMNLQELQTVVHHRLPIKLFVLDNAGYVSIRQTQDIFFQGRHMGSSLETGLSFPDVGRLAAAYGLPSARIDSPDGLHGVIRAVLEAEGPCLCHVVLPTDYKFSPKLSSETKPDGRIVSKPLEDMFPFLDRAEFRENMIVAPLAE